MSREFGEYYGKGYFHDKVKACANDLKESRYELHKMFIPFLNRFYKIAYAISSVEECDTSPSDSILAMIKHVPELFQNLEEINSALECYRDVMRNAVDEL